ncbi:MAG: Glycosyl transferase family 4 [Candidatus Peregrinibacteria bacterium GW2011_GWA2_47_7]|nr:MAG: Glycosyl transferase family 4 [Candidatus Peregrinibacteria bacterium GW2011_GWA2_47_7]
MFENAYFAGGFSFLFTLVGTLTALALFPRLKLLDHPELHGLDRAPIPYSGGLVLFFSFLFSTLIFIDLSKQVVAVIFAALLIAFVSFLDDRFFLSPFLRLGAQFLAGVIVVLGGIGIRSITNPFGQPIVLDAIRVEMFGAEVWLLSAAVIILWLILMMNVMNWLDGIAGLTSGVGVIASLVLFVLSVQGFHTVDQTTIVIFSISLAASLLAFWFFDFWPPKILMGDTGSMLVGFLLGVFAVFSGGKLATVLLIMGFPVLDALWIIARRIFSGRSPFRGDLKHFHHRLLRVGLSPRRALIFNYVLCALFGAIALFMDSAQQKALALVFLFACMIVAALFVVFLEKKRSP